MRRVATVMLAVFLLFVLSCARVSLFSDASLKAKTGIKYYTAKPYLLVVHTGAKDKPVESSVIYLPDLENPTYARPHAGAGSAVFNLGLTNGYLSTYGLTSDSKIPETVTAAGSVLTGAGGLLTGVAGLVKPAVTTDTSTKDFIPSQGGKPEEPPPDLKQVADWLDRIGDQIESAATKVKDLITDNQKVTALAILTTVKGSAAKLRKTPPPSPEDVKTIVKSLSETARLFPQILIADPASSDKESHIYNSLVTRLATELSFAMAMLSPPPDGQVFALYEIRQKAGMTTLVPVRLGY